MVLPNDFPAWFTQFLDEQLAEVPTFDEQPSYDIDNLSIAYIRLWSVYETYTKILNRLYEKRCALKEIDARIIQAEQVVADAAAWVLNAKKVSSSYLASIRFGDSIDIEESVTKLTAQVKTINVSKYSVRKSDIALMHLPSAKDIEKACVEIGLKDSGLGGLLLPSNSESKFYKTRNIIAHEGKSDIQLRNFILKRINPVREVVSIIKKHVDAT